MTTSSSLLEVVAESAAIYDSSPSPILMGLGQHGVWTAGPRHCRDTLSLLHHRHTVLTPTGRLSSPPVRVRIRPPKSTLAFLVCWRQ